MWKSPFRADCGRCNIRPDDPGPAGGGGVSPGGGHHGPDPDDDEWNHDFGAEHQGEDMVARVLAATRNGREPRRAPFFAAGTRQTTDTFADREQARLPVHPRRNDQQMPGALHPAVDERLARAAPLPDVARTGGVTTHVHLGGGLGYSRLEPRGLNEGPRHTAPVPRNSPPRQGAGGPFSRFGFGRRADN
jgi:hypothetical protein